jgi:hypothetical protein
MNETLHAKSLHRMNSRCGAIEHQAQLRFRRQMTRDAPSVWHAQAQLKKDSRQGIPRKDQGGQDLFTDSHRAVAITDLLQQGPYPFIANESTPQRQQSK